ncbi:MAG: hypothetical protein L6Q78_10875 [Bacteroidia bacterium]|nr:hypothetical protein [Bacteroidia bacterium]
MSSLNVTPDQLSSWKSSIEFISLRAASLSKNHPRHEELIDHQSHLQDLCDFLDEMEFEMQAKASEE